MTASSSLTDLAARRSEAARKANETRKAKKLAAAASTAHDLVGRFVDVIGHENQIITSGTVMRVTRAVRTGYQFAQLVGANQDWALPRLRVVTHPQAQGLARYGVQVSK